MGPTQNLVSNETESPIVDATVAVSSSMNGVPQPVLADGPDDLESIDLVAAADKGAEMKLFHPVSGRPTRARIVIVGADGETYRRNIRTIRDKISSNPEAEPTDPDRQAILQLARLAAAAVIGWEDLVFGGQRPKFSLDEAVRIFAARPWIIEQVNAFRDARSNFFKE